MNLFLFLVWLEMSAQTRHVIDDNPPCQSAKLYYNGVLVDEEPHCGFLLQPISMPTALDDITRAEFAEAAQRAADETDGKPPNYYDSCGNSRYPAEPVDVPAVQELQDVLIDCAQWEKNNCVKPTVVRKPAWTCADKSRILEHDENSPPKYWCRKVQP